MSQLCKSSQSLYHITLLSYVCVFMAGKAQTNPASVLWSIKLWLILPVMWKQRVYKMPSHNCGMIWFSCPRKRMLGQCSCLHGDGLLFLFYTYFSAWCCISMPQTQGPLFYWKIIMRIVIRGSTHRSSTGLDSELFSPDTSLGSIFTSRDALHLFLGLQRFFWLWAYSHLRFLSDGSSIRYAGYQHWKKTGTENWLHPGCFRSARLHRVMMKTQEIITVDSKHHLLLSHLWRVSENLCCSVLLHWNTLDTWK